MKSSSGTRWQRGSGAHVRQCGHSLILYLHDEPSQEARALLHNLQHDALPLFVLLPLQHSCNLTPVHASSSLFNSSDHSSALPDRHTCLASADCHLPEAGPILLCTRPPSEVFRTPLFWRHVTPTSCFRIDAHPSQPTVCLEISYHRQEASIACHLSLVPFFLLTLNCNISGRGFSCPARRRLPPSTRCRRTCLRPSNIAFRT